MFYNILKEILRLDAGVNANGPLLGRGQVWACLSQFDWVYTLIVWWFHVVESGFWLFFCQNPQNVLEISYSYRVWVFTILTRNGKEGFVPGVNVFTILIRNRKREFCSWTYRFLKYRLQGIRCVVSFGFKCQQRSYSL